MPQSDDNACLLFENMMQECVEETIQPQTTHNNTQTVGIYRIKSKMQFTNTCTFS